MHDSKDIENVLARLIPSAISDSSQLAIENLLDELATESEIIRSPQRPKWLPLAAVGIAATLVAAVVIFEMNPSPHIIAAIKSPRGVLLLGESDRVESMIDEGWHEISDGSAMRAMRLNVVEENRLFDEETGIVMQVTEPREEWLIMPVSAF